MKTNTFFKPIILCLCIAENAFATSMTPKDLSTYVDGFYNKAYTKERVDLSICQNFDTPDAPFNKKTQLGWQRSVDELTNYLLYFYSNEGVRLIAQTPFFEAPLRLARAYYLQDNEFVEGNQPKNRSEVLQASLLLYEGVWQNYQNLWRQTLEEIATKSYQNITFAHWAQEQKGALGNAYAAFFAMSGYSNAQKDWSSVIPTQQKILLDTLESIANPFPLEDLPRFAWLADSRHANRALALEIYEFTCRMNDQNIPPLPTLPMPEWLAFGESPVERGVQGSKIKFESRRPAF